MIVKGPDEKFPTAPEGSFPAVCVDNIDLGMVKSTYGGEEKERHMVRLVWQIDEEESPGKPFLVKQDYTASLHEKAALRKHLEAWRGRAFTDVELFGFDLDSILGAGCIVNIIHNKGRRGGTFANVAGIMKLAKGMTIPKVSDYVRVKDRKPKPAAPKPIEPLPGRRRVEEEPPDFAYGITDDDVPF